MNVPRENSLLRSARREAALVLVMWFLAMAYSVTFCYVFGYGRTTENLRFIWGFPDWVFWGVVVPWVLCAVLSLLISNFYMTDQDMGVDPDEAGEDDYV